MKIVNMIIDIVMMLVGIGIILTNIIHMILYGNVVSGISIVGGLLIMCLGLLNMSRNKNRHETHTS